MERERVIRLIRGISPFLRRVAPHKMLNFGHKCREDPQNRDFIPACGVIWLAPGRICHYHHDQFTAGATPTSVAASGAFALG